MAQLQCPTLERLLRDGASGVLSGRDGEVDSPSDGLSEDDAATVHALAATPCADRTRVQYGCETESLDWSDEDASGADEGPPQAEHSDGELFASWDDSGADPTASVTAAALVPQHES